MISNSRRLEFQPGPPSHLYGPTNGPICLRTIRTVIGPGDAALDFCVFTLILNYNPATLIIPLNKPELFHI
jgi:hypothetical protein